MGKTTIGAEAFRIEQDGAEFERGVIDDAKLPVRAEACSASIGQVALDDVEEIGDLLSTRLVGAEPSVLMPLLQAHRRCRQSTVCSPLSRCEYRHRPISVSLGRRLPTWRSD